jgi:hypothetical protein
MALKKQLNLFNTPKKPSGAKTKAQRAARKGVKAGGEAPCKVCKSVSFSPARNKRGRFAKK